MRRARHACRRWLYRKIKKPTYDLIKLLKENGRKIQIISAAGENAKYDLKAAGVSEEFFPVQGRFDREFRQQMKSGRKLFEEERMEFRRKLINFVYMPKKRINYKRMGMGIINSHLESFNIPYYVISRQETAGERRKDTYWILSQIPDFVSEEETLEKE